MKEIGGKHAAVDMMKNWLLNSKKGDKTEVKTDDKTAADEIKKLHEKLKEKIEKIENSAPAEQHKTDTSEKPEDKKTDEKPDENK